MGTTGLSITLANSIIGVGILAMPFCFQQCGLLLGTLILLSMGLMSRLCCYFLLKSALLARRRNFEFLAFYVFGSAGKMAVEVGIIGFLMGTCIAYFVVVGDLGPQIIAKMFNINQSDMLRTSIMVIVSLVCVLPLGLLRNVDSLSNVSAATIGFYFCLVIKVVVEAASTLMSSDWHRRVEMWRPAGLLQCVPIFAMALFCQAQLFEIFESLPTLSLEKMNLVSKNAINICTGVYLTLGVFGYIAFCSQEISGNILMSLSPTWASDVIKLGFVMSLAFSFPLIIFPCRASLYSFLYKKVHSSHHDHIINHSIPESTFRCITVAIVAVALIISLLIPNIELVLGLAGSTIGVLICVVFPAACFVNVTFKNTNERVLAKGVLVLGLIIMVLGTYANLEAAGESKIDRYDEKYTKERIDKIVEDFFEKRDKDDVYLKPQDINPLPIDETNIALKDSIKDSEVQPPNPVPPESQSNEKIPAPRIEINKYKEKKLAPVPASKEPTKKVIETHPKDVKTKSESKVNGINKPELETPKITKPQSNEVKNDIIKQQKLIETIKQHGEEQKELMKEQKEILDEIIKTKNELQQNKNDADTNEAKKIAVESIKQIADMAIKSIGGVSEKPDQVNDKKEDRLEKLANEAVQEIAKKAVETIEAIKEIKENPAPSKVAKDDSIQNNIPSQIINEANAPVQLNQNGQQQYGSQNMNQGNAINNNPNMNSQNTAPQPLNLQPRAINPPSQQLGGVPLQIQPQLLNSQSIQATVVNSQNVQQQIVNPANIQPPVKNSQNIQPPVMNSQNIQPQVVKSQNSQQQIVNSQNIQPQVMNSQNIQSQVVNSQIGSDVLNNAPPVNSNGNAENMNTKINPSVNVPQNNIASKNMNVNMQQVNNVPLNNDVAQPQNIVPVNIHTNKDVKAAVPNGKVTQSPKAQNQPAQAQNDDKLHSHAADEPLSYKQGEDAQSKNSEVKLLPNVALPKPITDLLSSKQIHEKEAAAEQVDDEIQVNVPKKIDIAKIQPSVVRQKREVIDCTQKLELKTRDIEICNTLVVHPKDIIAPVDLNDMLPKKIIMDTNMLHHIGRSLKSFEKDER